jgi:pantetheine-phosphate adenylyltransferase
MTNGHVDVILRAATLFDRIIVAVAESSRKTPFIDTENRIKLVCEVFASQKNIEVKVLNGLLVDFAIKENAKFILRGLRAVSDFDYEFQLAGMNRQMQPTIETVFLPSTEANTYISATIVREIITLGGDVCAFVPKSVNEYLKHRK